MTDELNSLIRAAKSLEQSKSAVEEQRRSFAYGNTKFENDRITREMIDSQADLMKTESR